MEARTSDTNNERRDIAKVIEAPVPTMELATRRMGGVVFANFGQVIEFAREMSTANIGVRKHLRGNVGACIAITIQALEWEMSAFAVASKSYSVNDQIAYEAQLINAVILRRAPIVGRFKISYSGVGENRVCTVALAMRDGTLDAVYESPLLSRIQPKNSPLWKTDPDQQLFYYSSRALCRRHFPDVLLGVYSVDELIDSEPMVTRETMRTPRIAASNNLKSRLDALAAEPSHDPDTGEIIDNEQTSTSQSSTDRRDEAAAGTQEPVETGAESRTDDRERDSAPEPQEPASPQGPQEGAGHSPPTQGAPAPSDPKTAADEARKARIAEIRVEGQAAAEGGQTSVMNFLEHLRGLGQADWASSTLKNSWRETAKAVDAKKAGARR